MNKEELQLRLQELDLKLSESIKNHNDMISEKDKAINQNLANHNMLIGQRAEVQDWLAKLEQPEA